MSAFFPAAALSAFLKKENARVPAESTRTRTRKASGTLRAVCFALGFAALLAGCGGAGERGAATDGAAAQDAATTRGVAAAETDARNGGARDSVTVAMGQTSEPAAGFDPAYGWGCGEHVHEPLIQSTLTVTNADMSIGYDLATDIAVSADGMTWTVRIRDGVLFSDGSPLTAEDVAFTYLNVKALSTVTDFTMLEDAYAQDARTAVFKMTRPYSLFPYTMANVGIVPKNGYDAAYALNPVGSGRYLLRQWDKGQRIVLEANPLYYGDAPKIKRVTVVFMGEDTAFASVMAGSVDIAYTAPLYATGNPPEGYELLSVRTVDNRGINLPVTAEIFPGKNTVTQDVRTRKALELGIDRDALISDALYGFGTPAYSVCDGMPWFSANVKSEYNPDAARALLEEAGWLPADDGIRTKDGVRARLDILYPAADSMRQAIAASLSVQLRELGIESHFEGVGWDTAYTRAMEQPLVWGWGTHSPMELYNIYHSDGQSGSARYSPYRNSELDAAMDAALASDTEASFADWQRAQEIAAEDCPWIWLVNVNHLYWKRTALFVAEQKPHPHGHGWSLVNNIDRWEWQDAASAQLSESAQ